jgi:hypothetical protein
MVQLPTGQRAISIDNEAGANAAMLDAATGIASMFRAPAGPREMPAAGSCYAHPRGMRADGRQAIEERRGNMHGLAGDALHQVGFPFEPSRGLLRGGVEVIENADDLVAADQNEPAAILALEPLAFAIIRAQLELQRSDHLNHSLISDGQ